MKKGNLFIRLLMVLLLAVGIGSSAVGCTASSGGKYAAEDCSKYRTKTFRDACNERNKNRGKDSTVSGEGPCKYKGNIIGSDPGTKGKQRLAKELLNSGCVTMSEDVCGGVGRNFASGEAHWKLYRQVQRIIKAKYKIGVSCLWSGHTKFVAGTKKISTHWEHRGMDLNYVNNQRVNTMGGKIDQFAIWLTEQPSDQLVNEIGMPPGYLDDVNRLKRNGAGPFFPESNTHFHFGVFS